MKISIISLFWVVTLCWTDWPIIWDSGWGNDYFEALHCDLAGNIIVGGWHYQQNGPYTQGFWDICKYDQSGNLLWHNTFYMSGGCILKDISVDLAGSILVGGYGGPMPGNIFPTWWLIAKYDSVGNLLWDSTYGHFYSGVDGIFGVASGIWSNWHVAVGFIWSIYPPAARVLKLDGAGTQIWDKVVDLGTFGIFTDVDIFQTSGDILTAGILRARGGGGLIKFDAYGNEIFTILKYDTLGNRLDSINVPMPDAVACRPDTFGNIFVGGMIGNPRDWIIYKIEPSEIREHKNIRKPSVNSLILSKNPVRMEVSNLSCVFSLAESQNVSLSLYALTGQHIATLIEGYQNQGTHSVNIKFNNLSAGVYLVVLKTSKEILTRKLIVF